MKIGILTYHRSHNYGALLQAIALRKTISKLGYDVKYIDYWPKYHSQTYVLINWNQINKGSFIKTIESVLSIAINFPFKYSRIRKFRKFIEKYITPYCCPSTNSWDIMICGSDQIWRKQPNFDNRFNPEYFGARKIKVKNLISYAASMGRIDIEISELPVLVEWLEKFKNISVREEPLRELLLSGGLKDVTTVLDPTFLITKEEWSSIIGIEQDKHVSKYLLVYDLLNGSFDRNAINKFAQQRGLEVKILRGEASKESYSRNTISVADPFDMVRLIRGAEMVFTSSYHGLVFSILFERQFFASFLSNGGRADSLLSQIGLSDRLIPARSNTFPSNKINYIPVFNRLRSLQDDSIMWLKKALVSYPTK